MKGQKQPLAKQITDAQIGKFVWCPRLWCKVKLMALSDGWAMVRRPGCIPLVERARELERLP